MGVGYNVRFILGCPVDSEHPTFEHYQNTVWDPVNDDGSSSQKWTMHDYRLYVIKRFATNKCTLCGRQWIIQKEDRY